VVRQIIQYQRLQTRNTNVTNIENQQKALKNQCCPTLI